MSVKNWLESLKNNEILAPYHISAFNGQNLSHIVDKPLLANQQALEEFIRIMENGIHMKEIALHYSQGGDHITAANLRQISVERSELTVTLEPHGTRLFARFNTLRLQDY